MNDTPTPQTGESPSDSLVSFTMNQLTNRIATLETDLAKALAERDEARAEASRAWGLNTSQTVQIALMSNVRIEIEAERDAALAQLAEWKQLHDQGVVEMRELEAHFAEARKDSERRGVLLGRILQRCYDTKAYKDKGHVCENRQTVESIVQMIEAHNAAAQPKKQLPISPTP